MTKIFFSQEELDKCKLFSQSIDTSFYARRNQFNNVKRIADNRIGKLGEIAAYNVLIEKYPDITYPDFKIYKPREKSWDYDMKHKDFCIHIKSQETLQSSKYKESWVFQNEDKHVFKEYFDKDYVIFVKVNLFKKYAEIRKILPVILLHEEKLFKPLILKHLSSKSAIYFEDIQDFDNFLI